MKYILFIFILLYSLSVQAQESGIQFHKDAKWADLLAKAKSENKLIFMDAFTAWCGPCKMMDKNVFSSQEVGSFYNANFVNVKMDMEQGEGKTLAETYEIQAYPTLLFIDGDGKAVHKIVGYYESPDFLLAGKIATDPEKRLDAMLQRYKKGERAPEFMNDLIKVSDQAMYSGMGEIAEEYLKTQSDWASVENMRLIVNHAKLPESKMFQYLVANKAKFETEFGKPAVISKLQEVLLNDAYAKNPGKTFEVEDVLAIYKAKVPSAVADELYLLTKMDYYRMRDESENYFKTTIEYFEKYPSNDFNQLNEEAWAFYESVEDKEMLKKAVKWAEKSVQINSLYFNNDTLAALYYKIGDQKKAKKTAEKAIELAKASGEDYAATQELLEKIKKMK